MQKKALYRRYRPQTFKDVVGQEHITKVLEEALKLGNLSHAYLFAGGRGTGKTSVARIVARELKTSSNDLHEMDAASNRGIDDIRGIRESVHSLPFESKYKVYIVDEAHMLTKEAWNAFLKTLEEPPEHVIFILATTELEKIPETVLSRCQVFQFKKPSRKEIKDLILAISKKEGFTLETEAGELIALLGDNSFRDAQGILEKILSFSKDKKISREEVEAVTGAPKAKLVTDFVRYISDESKEGAISVMRRVGESGGDIKIFLTLVLEKMRFALLLRISPDIERDLEKIVTVDEMRELKEIAKNGKKLNSETLYKLLNALDMTDRTYDPLLPIELAIAEIMTEVK